MTSPSRIAVRMACALAALALVAALAAARAVGAPIRFATPSVVDPLRTNGEPDVAVDPSGRVFSSGPTGTGTQRSVWYGSVDGGGSFRPINPPPAPTAFQSFIDPPGGGDTDIAFDRSGKQYFSDLYALACFREAVTTDGGANVTASTYPGGCGGTPPADRQWLAVYDPPPGTPNQSAYTGPRPLIYQEFNNVVDGTQWVKSSAAVDPLPGGPGLTYAAAQQDPDTPQYAPVGADGYPAIDQVTGKVLQAASIQDPDGKTFDLVLNIGTPDAAGDLKFLDAPPAPGAAGDQSKLIHIADHIHGNTGVLFDVASMDAARNLYVAWTVDDPGNKNPLSRQVWVSAASAASGWRAWSAPVQVSDGSTATGDAVNVMPWLQAGAAGRADVVWYGSDKAADPSTKSGQAWNVFMSQVVFPLGAAGGVTGAPPSRQLVRVSPHPMHYEDICLEGTDCIESQGNRNLADFFQVKVDRSGAAEVVYDDTSNGLVQPGFTAGGQELIDHSGAPVVTLARQSSGPGLLGSDVSGPSSAPVAGLDDQSGDALYPVIGGAKVEGFDLLGERLSLSGGTLHVTMRVADLAHPSAAAGAVPATQQLQYVTRWQLGNVVYYAAMSTTPGGQRSFFAGPAQSVDLCSVSACFPHVITYPEPAYGGKPETGNVSCPSSPSPASPCTITIDVKGADVGSPAATSLLEEAGAYALAASHDQGATTNAQAQADNVPLEIDGSCCFDFRASSGARSVLPPPRAAPRPKPLHRAKPRRRACAPARRHRRASRRRGRGVRPHFTGKTRPACTRRAAAKPRHRAKPRPKPKPPRGA